MPSTSVLFEPEIDERSLDKEVDNVNDQLDEAASDIETNIDAEVDGMSPPGVAGGGRDGGLGPGGAAGVGSLASKIPKPVAGVTAAAALPIALAGGVGLGMLSAMRSSSARLQTSTSLMSQAWNNVWRPLGDDLDQLFVRDVARDMVQETQNFEETWRNNEEFSAIKSLLSESIGTGSPLGLLSGAVLMKEMGTRVLDWLRDSWPGWPSVDTSWPGWPDIGGAWPGWPSVKGEWGGWPDLGNPEWPSTDDLLSLFPTISGAALISAIVSDEEGNGGNGNGDGDGGDDDGIIPGVIDPRDEGGIEYPGGGGTPDPIYDDPDNVPVPTNPSGQTGLASGGFVNETGVAMIHRGERVLPEAQVSDRGEAEVSGVDASTIAQGMERALSRSGGGRDGNVERKLDRLHKDLQRLESALDVTLQIGTEEVGRAAADGKKNRMADTDPTV